MPPRSTAPRCPRRPTRSTRRLPLLSISIAVVAILAGSALFMSGYSLGRQAAGDPGTPASDVAAFQPFWDTYHSISDRYAGGAVDQTLGHPGRHPRDDRFARRPVLRLPVGRRLPQEPAGHQRPVRGDRRRDHVAGRRRDGRLRAARSGLPARGDPADPRLAGRDRRRPGRATSSSRSTARALDGLDVDGARDRIRGKKGTRRQARPPARRQTGRARHHPRRRPGAGGRDEGAGGRRRRLRAGVGLLGRVCRRGRRRRSRTISRPAGRSFVLDLRGNPGGYVTAARKIASQFVGSGVALLGAGRPGQRRSRPTRSATASRPTRRSSWSSSSTTAARRRARSSRERSRTRSGRRSSASSRSARAPSSSGSS